MASVSLNVIALISGGKDSFFSILHCHAQGHKVIALANLFPALSEYEDIDSYMYQTVGHTIIPLYEEALGIPLYRQTITGSATDTNRDYRTPLSQTDEDETESLIPLLRRVKEAHPEANAISTGAILSSYQRTRVESVALRLGLTPLSYLWQYPYLPPYVPSQLLRDMQTVGQDARIIKIASGGLDETFLGENVADKRVIKRLLRSTERFGSVGDGAVLGEGGEFETLTIDGPSYLWKKRIIVEEQHVAAGEGGSAILRIQKASLTSKTDCYANSLGAVREPQLLEGEFAALYHTLRGSSVELVWANSLPTLMKSHDNSRGGNLKSPAILDPHIIWSRKQVGGMLYISNMTSTAGHTPEEQMQHIVRKLQQLCSETDPRLHTSMITNTTMLLRSMSDFTKVNPIYGSLFTEPNPPARVTVACGDCMPAGIDVLMSIGISSQQPSNKSGLHVQSRSYWAPANIGPYSQAIAVDLQPNTPRDQEYETEGHHDSAVAQLVHVAGQIPLIPASMEMAGMAEAKGVCQNEDAEVTDVFLLQTVLSLQHLWRVGRAMRVKWWTGAVAFLASGCAAEESKQRAMKAIHAWSTIHKDFASNAISADENEEEDVDVWDIRNGVSAHGGRNTDAPYRPTLPVFTDDLQAAPPCFAVQVEELPRGAQIEWMSSGLTTTNLRQLRSGQTCSLTATNFDFSTMHVALEHEQDIEALAARLPTEAHLTAFVSNLTAVEPLIALSASVIPCRRIWSESGKEVLALVVVRSVVDPHR